MILGAIGDDFTGSSDLGLMLADGGMNTVQYVGVPGSVPGPEVEAGIVALKSRSIPVKDAVDQSLAALEWLLSCGCQQIYFKICSTFDSTKTGNIGPVAEALIERLGTRDPVVVCPVFPATGRTLYQGHLFVGDALLSESGLQNHPITPMTDPDIRRWLAHQSEGAVGHVPLDKVRLGAAGCRDALAAQNGDGRQLVVVDAIDDDDLRIIAEAAEDFGLLVGGSGIGLGLPAVYRSKGLIGDSRSSWTGNDGKAVALSGSCSMATSAQVAEHGKNHPQMKIDTDALMAGQLRAKDLADWAMAEAGLPLIYSSDDPAAVSAAQDKHGGEKLAGALENLFGEVARDLKDRGVGRLIVAGGETSGAVVTALDLHALAIGPKIDPGVPAISAGGLALALKSGNFGAPDFFEKAMTVMAQ